MKELNNVKMRVEVKNINIKKKWYEIWKLFQNVYKENKSNVKENSFKISIHRTIKRKLHVFAKTI